MSIPKVHYEMPFCIIIQVVVLCKVQTCESKNRDGWVHNCAKKDATYKYPNQTVVSNTLAPPNHAIMNNQISIPKRLAYPFSKFVILHAALAQDDNRFHLSSLHHLYPFWRNFRSEQSDAAL